MKTNKFRFENGRVDWDSLLFHIYESGGKATKSLREWAEEFEVHLNHLNYRYSSYEAAMNTHSGNLVGYSEALTRRELNIKKEQAKLSLMRKELNKLVKETTLRDIVTDEFILPKVKVRTIKKFKPEKEARKGEQLFFISDLHYYNEELSEVLFDISKMILSNWDGSSKIILVLGGDYIENRHHGDQIINIKSAMIQTNAVSDILVDIVADILSNTDAEVEMHLIVGNHDTIRQGNERSGDNMDEHVGHTIYSIINKGIQDERFTLTYPTYELDLTFGGRRYNFRHGHVGNISDKMLMKKMMDNELQTGESFDTYVVGHFHRFNDWFKKGTSKRFIISPAMKTYNDNFENSNVLRSTVGIVRFDEDNKISFVPWEGTKKNTGQLK